MRKHLSRVYLQSRGPEFPEHSVEPSTVQRPNGIVNGTTMMGLYRGNLGLCDGTDLSEAIVTTVHEASWIESAQFTQSVDDMPFKAFSCTGGVTMASTRGLGNDLIDQAILEILFRGQAE